MKVRVELYGSGRESKKAGDLEWYVETRTYIQTI